VNTLAAFLMGLTGGHGGGGSRLKSFGITGLVLGFALSLAFGIAGEAAGTSVD
jgi:hypothetical protein